MFHNQSFGSVDPQFGLDNGFYVFVLPGLRMLVSAFTLLMFVALVFSVATHVAMGGIRFTMRCMATVCSPSRSVPVARSASGWCCGCCPGQ